MAFITNLKLLVIEELKLMEHIFISRNDYYDRFSPKKQTFTKHKEYKVEKLLDWDNVEIDLTQGYFEKCSFLNKLWFKMFLREGESEHEFVLPKVIIVKNDLGELENIRSWTKRFIIKKYKL